MVNNDTWLTLVKSGDSEAVAAALQRDLGLANRRDENGIPATLLALYFGHAETARLIANHKTKLDIFEAAALGETIQLENLLDSHPDSARSVASDGFSPLGLACFFGQVTAARLLLAAGADPNQPADNPTRVMPLHSAAASTDPSAAVPLCKLLLEAGAQVNARQQGGFTALHAAAQNGNMELIDLLLAHGADPGAHSAAGLTASDYAAAAGHAAAAARLGNSS
jgi:ankyrin repeat protein